MSTRTEQPDLTETPRFLRVGIPVFLVGSFLVWILPAPDLPAYDLRRLLQVVALVLLGAWAVLHPRAGARLAGGFLRLPAAARWGLSLSVVVGLAAAVVASRPEIALRELSLWVLLVAVGLVVAGGRRRTEGPASAAVLDAVVVAGIAYVGMYVFDAVVSGTATSLPGFEHPRQFNHVQVLLMPLLVAASVSDRWSVGQRGVLWLALTGWWHLLFVSGGRAALLATVIGIGVGAALVRRHALRWGVTYVITGIAGAAVYGATLLRAETPTAAYGISNAVERGATATGRGHLWDLAVEYARANPILGIGPGHYAHEEYVAEYAASPHNLLLQFAAEWGLVVTAVLLLLAAWGAIAWLRNAHRRAGSPMTAALTAALVGVSIDGMFGGSINDPTAGVLAALVVGLALGRSRAADRTEDETGAAVGLLVVVAAAVLTLAATTAITYRSPAEETGEIIRPRYWLNGVAPQRTR